MPAVKDSSGGIANNAMGGQHSEPPVSREPASSAEERAHAVLKELKPNSTAEEHAATIEAVKKAGQGLFGKKPTPAMRTAEHQEAEKRETRNETATDDLYDDKSKLGVIESLRFPHLNNGQLKVLWVGIGLVVLMGLVPPWVYKADGHIVSLLGYGSLFSPPEECASGYANSIDIVRLCIQWLLVSVVCGGWILTLQSSKPDVTLPALRRNSKFARVEVVVPIAVLVMAMLPYALEENNRSQKKAEAERFQMEEQAKQAKEKERQAKEDEQREKEADTARQQQAEDEAQSRAQRLAETAKQATIAEQRAKQDEIARQREAAVQRYEHELASQFVTPVNRGTIELSRGIKVQLETTMSADDTVSYRLLTTTTVTDSHILPPIMSPMKTLVLEDKDGFSLLKYSFTWMEGLQTGSFQCSPETYQLIAGWHLEEGW